jgi:peptidoglycan hydrolase CwlO-like protein
MLQKYVKYALLLNASVISSVSQKIFETTDQFVKTNADEDYKNALSETFDNIQKSFREFSPQIEKVTESVNKVRDNILDFSKKIKP